MENTKIGWATHTFNAWAGCQKVSPECAHCYAESLDKRWHKGANWGPNTPRKLASDNYWKQLDKWNKAARLAGQPALVFVNSMSDIGEDHPDVVVARSRLFGEIPKHEMLNFLLLTKRLANLERFLDTYYYHNYVNIEFPWPDNIWLGTTIGAQKRAGEAELLATMPNAVRFVSAEPLLEPIELDLDMIQWLIVGGESGPGARRMDLAWVDSLMVQCRSSGTKFFFKQLGSVLAKEMGLKGKGDNPAEWPEWLRVQEIPDL